MQCTISRTVCKYVFEGKPSIHPIRSNHDSCSETLHLLDDVDPGEVEADVEAADEDAGAGGDQVPQPAQHSRVGAQQSQHNHATVLA